MCVAPLADITACSCEACHARPILMQLCSGSRIIETCLSRLQLACLSYSCRLIAFAVPLVVSKLHSCICPKSQLAPSSLISASSSIGCRRPGGSGAHLSAEALCSDVRQSQSQSLQGQWLSAGRSAPGPLSPAGSCPFAPSGGGSQSARPVAPVLGNPAPPTSVVTNLGETSLWDSELP